MKKYIAVFEVPDGYKPTDYLENADGWFTDEEGNRCTVGTKLEEAKQGEWISKEEALKIMCEKCPVYNCVSGCNSYRSIEKMSSVQSQRPKGGTAND